MTASQLKVENPFNDAVLSISGTLFQQQGTFQAVVLFGTSGNTLIPIRCDSTGKIENTT